MPCAIQMSFKEMEGIEGMNEEKNEIIIAVLK